MKKLKKIVATLLAFAIVISAVPVTNVQAKGETWTHAGDGWHYLEGTDVKVQIDGDTIRIKGSGAIPDYDYWSLSERPWAKTTCHYLMIDSTITSIGSYAFYGMENIKYIFLSSKTFINDSTCFEKIAYKPIIRLTSDGEETRMFGTIAITSLDSIKRMAQSNWNGASFILDSKSEADRFQQSTNPTITNVFSATDENAPWNKLEDNGNGGVSTSICSIATPGVSAAMGVYAQHVYQGNACYEAYAAFIGDYNFATTFNIVLMNAGKKVEKTGTELQYTLSIPNEFRAPGRTFKLLAIGVGEMYTYDDLDTAYETITFSTDKPTTSYALIYQ